MRLPAGTRFGTYEITGLLGAGGMGEVYRARDQKLGREVALKVMPAAFTTDAERLARFEREARVLASLNHPHIAAIYGIEEGPSTDSQLAGTRALVLELVEGETLAGHVERGPLPMREALRVGAHIADALEAAHEQGIVHRDLKPANILISRRGVVKVLDFGLAKALSSARPGALPAQTTLEADRTVDGAVMGTTAYMSPEQTRGEEVDKRSDVWSFGCVLYEMLTGRSAFARASTAETVAAILDKPPDWSRLPPGTPSDVLRLLERCLEKDRARRLRDIGDARATLTVSETSRTDVDVASERTVRRPSPRPARLPWPIAIAAVVALIVLSSVAWWRFGGAGRDEPGIQSLAVLPLKPLVANADGNYLGLAIADGIILGLSRARALTVRPTSAVREYRTGDVDPLEAGAALKADAVLDGTWQRDADRYRVNLRLLRTDDGASLWSDQVEVRGGDVFALQDQVANRITARLQLDILPGATTRPQHRPTAEAYELFARGLLHLVQRGYSGDDRAHSDLAVQLFEQAVRADPEYAEAHAMLGFAYVWTAIFIEENASLIDRAEAESNVAERLDPTLGRIHLNRALIQWSWYRGWRIVEGLIEMRRAIELTPSLSDNELGTLYYHLGLFDEWRSMNERSIALNPTDRRLISTYVNEFFLVNFPEGGLAVQRELLGNTQPDWRYHLGMRQLDEAAPLLEAALASRGPGTSNNFGVFALAKLRALQGRQTEAERIVTRELARIPRNRSYHHHTYTAAQVYALGGKSTEAARWLRQTIDEGFPCYPLFTSDPLLDPVRTSSEVKAVLDAFKTTWDGYLTQLRHAGVVTSGRNR